MFARRQISGAIGVGVMFRIQLWFAKLENVIVGIVHFDCSKRKEAIQEALVHR